MEDFVTFEIAKKLKEKGFREECSARYYCSDEAYFEENGYHPDTESVFYCYNNDEDLGRFYIDAPTISQVLKWLRMEKKISIEIGIHYSLKWMCSIYGFSDGIADFTQYDNDSIDDTIYILYDSYEQATLAGIEYVLDNLI